MQIRHIVVAADESEAGREALRAALAVARRAGARITVVRAVPASRTAPAGAVSGGWRGKDGETSEVEDLRHWVEADLPLQADGPVVSFAVAHGLPSVELSRFAEHERADLMVLGRKARSPVARVAVGDTADAVARRCPVPCLFVPPAGLVPREVLAAVDGSDRGMRVLTAAESFCRQVRAPLRVVTVEPRRPDEPAHLAAALASGQSANLRRRMRIGPGRALEVRRGEAVEEILAAVDSRHPDVLVIGCHRGGPPGILDAGSTARRLAHTAPCAILTVPL